MTSPLRPSWKRNLHNPFDLCQAWIFPGLAQTFSGRQNGAFSCLPELLSLG
jgi:hypothetical protein